MKKKHWSHVQILAVGFAGIILLGALALQLPFASRDGHSIPFLNALFTSASATCVTGLVLYDTWTQFSLFGQAVILLLIQVGGLGFMTAVIAISLLTHRRIGLWQRSVLAESVGSTQLAGIVRLSRRILLGTVLLEGCGAVLLSFRFIPVFGPARGLWFSVFHAISAFCNAGFDLMGALAPGSSLALFFDDPLVLLTIAFLIIAGGIGFLVWDDLMERRNGGRKLRLHSRVALRMTAVLILLGSLGFLALEWNGSMAGMSPGARLLSSFFQSVTPRTAGFSALNPADLTEGGKALTMLLMLIGAAPSGTGGGIKVTTFLVILSTAYASLSRREEVSVFHFRLEEKAIRRAFSLTTVYLATTLLAVLILCTQGVLFTDALFECLSAVGTVGLSTGVTPGLTAPSKLVIILLMYTGRIGSLTVFLAVGRKNSASALRDPVGEIIVG